MQDASQNPDEKLMRKIDETGQRCTLYLNESVSGSLSLSSAKLHADVCHAVLLVDAILYTIHFRINLHNSLVRVHASSSSDLSDTESLSVSHPSASRSALCIPKDNRNPIKATPPKTPNASASPFGLTLVATVKRPPLRKGPAARPAADNVCANPLRAPRTW